jgi:hypothetical protein
MAINKNPLEFADMNLGSDEPMEMEFDVNEQGQLLTQEEEDDFFLLDEDSLEFDDNLVSLLDEDERDEIANQVIEMYMADSTSREDWLKKVTEGLNLLGTNDKGDDPLFEGSCPASHPLILENAVKFQARASDELLPADGPVKTKILGQTSREKEEDATAIREHMNWQLTTEMPEYYPEAERNFIMLSIVGKGIKKCVFDTLKNRPTSYTIPIDQVVVAASATSLASASRISELIYYSKNDMNKLLANGFYEDPDLKLGSPMKKDRTEFSETMDEVTGVSMDDETNSLVYNVIEQHVEMYIEAIDEDEDEIARPYIITVDLDSEAVLSIRRNYDEGDPSFTRKDYFVEYDFVPAFGFYGMGFIHLLGSIQKTLTASLRALVDAGNFANLPAGFKNSNIRYSEKDTGTFTFGEFKDIDTAGMSLRDAFMPLPFKEPSGTLLTLMQWLDGRGQKFADSTEQVVADSQNYGPVGTTMALLDASAKFQSALHKRLHCSLKKEIEIIARLNKEYMDDYQILNLPEREVKITRQAYLRSGVAIMPVSDPNIASNAQRVANANALVQMAQQSPAGAVNYKELLKRAYLAMGEKDIDTLIPPEQEVQPLSPMEDIIEAANSKPIKAFEGQDHQAHIQAKSAWLQDPVNGGGNPMFAQAVPLIQANIKEHTLMDYQEKINAQVTGVASDPQTQSMLQAQAAQNLARMNQEALKAAQGPDPAEKIAEAELMRAKVDADELDFKKKKALLDAINADKKLDIELLKEYNDTQEAKAKLEADLLKKRIETGSKLVDSSIKNYREDLKDLTMKDSVE